MEIRSKLKKVIQYAEKAESFQRVKNLYQFQRLMGTDPFRLNYHLNKPLYHSFRVPKKRGGYRTIQSPNEELKFIQVKLNIYLQSIYFLHKPTCVHGFVFNPLGSESSCNIVSNARAHCGKKHLLNMDLQEFFPSISAKQVKESLQRSPFDLPEELAVIVALLGSYEKKLPTGAPTSPVLSNIVCLPLDLQLLEFCSKNELVYTRYADDLSFSSDKKISENILQELRSMITHFGFQLNEKKFRLQSSRSRQTVTGLVVNQRPNVERKYIRRLRAIVHSIKGMGVELAAAKHYGLTELQQVNVPKFLRKIKGQIEFVGMVRGRNDAIYRRLKEELAAHQQE